MPRNMELLLRQHGLGVEKGGLNVIEQTKEKVKDNIVLRTFRQVTKAI